jgi:hypothetical protein
MAGMFWSYIKYSRDLGKYQVLLNEIKNVLPYKPHTIEELITEIYEDNYSHFEFMTEMNGGDCDCSLHITMNTIVRYWGE